MIPARVRAPLLLAKALCLTACLAAPAAAAPGDPDEGRSRLEQLRAEQAEREARSAELEQAARQAAEDAAALQRDMVELGDEIAALERAAGAAEATLEDLNAEEAGAETDLVADRAALVRTLAALQRAEMRKPPPLAVSPDDAAGAARAAGLMGAIAPALEGRAAELRDRIANLARLRAAVAAERQALLAAQEGLGTRRLALADRLEERQALEQTLRADAEEEQDAARRIAQEATDLADLIARLEREAEERARREAEARARALAEAEARRRAEEEARREAERLEAERQAAERRAAGREPVPPAILRPPRTPAPDPVPDMSVPIPSDPLPRGFAEARGMLRQPAEGRVVAGFGTPRQAGSSEGVTIATRPLAQIVSPFDARVEFADTFGNYGQMLILAVGDGYHIILAGLERLYAVQGQSVLAGEPLGEMADRTAPAPELHYEIRRNGAPVDPGPWMQAGARAG